MYIDTHAHLTMPEYSDLPEVLSRAHQAQVNTIINASFDLESSYKSCQLATEYDFIYATVGIHPHDSDLVDEKSLAEVRKLAENRKVVAIGETGLDYHYTLKPVDVQQQAFRQFLRLTQKIDKPVVIHCREAQDDTIRIIKEENRGQLRGVFHCFAGDEKLMQFAVEIGFYVSFTGIVTFKKAVQVHTNVINAPLKRLLLETDCPYLAPEPYRGKRNEPSYLPLIAKAISSIKNVPEEALAAATTTNAKKLFSI